MTVDVKNEFTVGELVVQDPNRARVFEKFGIDYCCGGKVPLEEACAKRDIDVDAVRSALRACEETPALQTDRDWATAPLSELVDHIVTTHHNYLREEFPRLTALCERVAHVHGERRPALVKVRDVFAALRQELEAHMEKEEQILFPMITQMDGGAPGSTHACGSIENPIRMMEHEHEDAGDALAELRALTNGYVIPLDACTKYRVLLDGLAKLEEDLHCHIHKENNILFPRTLSAVADRT